jgi:hypothetical protein
MNNLAYAPPAIQPRKRTSGYLGNPKLRRAFTQISLTEHQLQEYIRCVNDPIYFTKKYVKIVALGKGIVPFDLYDFQEDMLTTFEEERFVLCKIPRQSGKTITTVAYLLHKSLFNENYNIAILAHKGTAANGILARFRLAYENLPTWMQSGIIEWNKGNIELENGSKIGAFATTADGLRSGSYDCITGDSLVTIRENGVSEEVTIEHLYERIKANSSNYIYTKKEFADVYREQIHEMVFQNYRVEKSPRAIIEYHDGKAPHHTKVYGWKRRSRKLLPFDIKGTRSCSQTSLSYGIQQALETETSLCSCQNAVWSSGKSYGIWMGKTKTHSGSTIESTKGTHDRKNSYRRDKRKNTTGKYRSSCSRSTEKKTVGKNEREILWSNSIIRDKIKNESCSKREEKNERAYRENQSKSREDQKNSREASRNEAIGRSQRKNEQSQKGEIYTLEQRLEVKTASGFKKFDGIKRIRSKNPLIEITLESGQIIKCTQDHLLMSSEGWSKAIECSGHIQTTSGFRKIVSKKIISNEYVYDLLEVEDTHSFFANGILVHNCIFLDEFAFVPQNIAEEFFTSTYPVITAGTDTKIIIVSTPKGMNHFFTMWVRAEKGLSDYKTISVNWWDIPGRDQAWKEETIRNTSEEQFRQEFETEFLGSSNTLISSSKIKQLLAMQENPIERDGKFDIFEKPIEDHTYCLTVDVSEGQGLDYSTFAIIDVTKIPYKLVAKYRNNEIAPLLFPTVILQAAQKYNEAFVLVEINSIGLQVADILYHEFAYENLIKVEVKGKQGQQHTPGFKKKIAYGLKMSKQTKAIGCANLKTLIESDKLIILDEEIVKEFTTFTIHKQTYKAEGGNHDDLVMTLVHFGWLTSQRYFKENINNNIRSVLQKEQMNLMDSDVVPFGFINNGIDDPMGDINADSRERWINSHSQDYFDILSNKHRL